MTPDMKWHIYNSDGICLFWDEYALEFDTRKSAERFLETAIINSEHLEDFWTGAEIKEDILFIDADRLDGTHAIVDWDAENDECILNILEED